MVTNKNMQNFMRCVQSYVIFFIIKLNLVFFLTQSCRWSPRAAYQLPNTKLSCL